MANKNMFEQAIIDAKSIREAAFANAKLALEENLTEGVKELLAEKLKALEEEDESIEEVADMEEGNYEEGVEEVVAEEEGEEVEAEEELEDEEAAEEDSEEIEDEVEDSEEGESELEDMSKEDLKDLIRDILAQEMGEDDEDEADMEVDLDAPAEDDIEEPAEMDAEEDEEIDLEELLSELTEGDMEEGDMEEGASNDDQGNQEVAEGDMEEGDMEEEVVSEGDPVSGLTDAAAILTMLSTAGAMGILYNADRITSAVKKLFGQGKEKEAAKVAADAMKGNVQAEGDMELEEALATIETLQEDLNEVNLLNAKLLYLNKIFKTSTLSESQKANTITAFDKAETVKEVKLVFETINTNLSAASNKKAVNEVKGMASKATGVAPAKPQVLNEGVSEAVLRMQKLAGIIK